MRDDRCIENKIYSGYLMILIVLEPLLYYLNDRIDILEATTLLLYTMKLLRSDCVNSMEFLSC